YLDGNSLGALPRRTIPRLHQVIAEEWGDGLIRSWNDAHWIEAPVRIGDKIAGLIGAKPGEVIVADSTSVNRLKPLAGARRLAPADRSRPRVRRPGALGSLAQRRRHPARAQ